MWTSVRVKFFELVKLAFRYDSVIGDLSEHDGTTERLVEHHHIFLNNLGRPEAEIPAKSHQFYDLLFKENLLIKSFKNRPIWSHWPSKN